MLEIRGVGIIKMRTMQKKHVVLIVNLDAVPERFPENVPTCNILGTDIPCFAINAFEPSAPLKVEAAVKRVLKQQQFV